MDGMTIGIDLAKDVFSLCAMDSRGKVLWRRTVRRRFLLAELRGEPACTVAMESCAGAHYWAREFSAMGHEVRLIAGQYVKAYVKGNKNDAVDAEAICEAARRPSMRFVPQKSRAQQEIQALHRVRERLVGARTALANQIRGFLMEFGVSVPVGLHRLKRALPEILENGSEALPPLMAATMRELYEELSAMDARLAGLDRKLRDLCRADQACARLCEIPGIGPLTASALVAAAGDGRDFKNGRHFAAWLGLVPREHSSGGRQRLLGISKRGDAYIRKLLILGAHSVLIARGDLGSAQQWAKRLKQRTGTNKAAVALANKNARIAWNILRGARYEDRAMQAAA